MHNLNGNDENKNKKTNHNIKWSIHCLLTNKIFDEEKSNPWRLNYQRIEEKKKKLGSTLLHTS
jgi:hypothetical protein